MKNGKKEIKLSSNKGFSLFEVLIALGIFASFITAFVSTQGRNLLDSQQMSEEIILKNLAETKINEMITARADMISAIKAYSSSISFIIIFFSSIIKSSTH